MNIVRTRGNVNSICYSARDMHRSKAFSKWQNLKISLSLLVTSLNTHIVRISNKSKLFLVQRIRLAIQRVNVAVVMRFLSHSKELNEVGFHERFKIWSV